MPGFPYSVTPYIVDNLKNFTELEKAYFAGIIDGEGCLSASPFISKKNPNQVTVRYSITITNTNIELLNWLNERLPSTTYRKHRSLAESHHLPCYNYMISGAQKVNAILIELLPYLIIKKSQAEHLISGYRHLDGESRLAFCEYLKTLKR